MQYQIRVLSTGQTYKIETEETLAVSQKVVVEAEQILEPGIVLCEKCPKRNNEILSQATFVRVQTPEDQSFKNQLKLAANRYLIEAQEKAGRHNLDMKIVNADLSFDEKKLTIYFSAENRIDFRSLVSDMVGSFRKIIRLQQIGPREEASAMGGIGRCGQEICCHRFLKDLDGVSGEMASLQEFGGKLSKMTGCCGRLMCCLLYEVDNTKDLQKEAKK